MQYACNDLVRKCGALAFRRRSPARKTLERSSAVKPSAQPTQVRTLDLPPAITAAQSPSGGSFAFPGHAAGARGRGVAAALTDKALQLAGEMGARTVDLTSRPSREAANRLYERAGFQRRDSTVYRLELDPAGP
ncbi:GNAT family N-acetyltransferase [Microtetraspora malaysiensis]|uniref:GNAT family N-acetyltransferase n=1 Tax=Microtetraspora malaysiensis TaxID=161358 RepID=A0ABW6T3M4_9ACTN